MATTKVIALGGNPNVGKSTVFNALTGLRQHTGNWPGKTVVNAQGRYQYMGDEYLLIDLPGAYSLLANSQEEEVAGDFICFGRPDVIVIVADATCLERNLILLLQVLEVTERVILCVNLLDEAQKKGINIDLPCLSAQLGIPVVGAAARNGRGLDELMIAIRESSLDGNPSNPLTITYDEDIESVLGPLATRVAKAAPEIKSPRWASLRLLEGDKGFASSVQEHLGCDLLSDESIALSIAQAKKTLHERGIDQSAFRDRIVSNIVRLSEKICAKAVSVNNENYHARNYRIDKILTSKITGIPLMILLLLAIFWLTISGANYPSELLAKYLFAFMTILNSVLNTLGAPSWLVDCLVNGVYKTVAWVVSVMLPPMAIFFPLFTLLEDLGYLPRVAFNLDHLFRKAGAHGKQALTMCMSFGCNAVGVIGCRIIDSPRERMIAIITNSLIPCNGRFPALIALIALFFTGSALTGTLLLSGFILLGVALTLAGAKLLSSTVLKGLPSSFQLELPPYRRPQIVLVIVRSVIDRTLFVLGRAVMIAAPAGVLIWILANIQIGEVSLLTGCANLLAPFAHLLGLDGYIMLAFILGLPANEIVLPILMMAYLSSGSLTGYTSLEELGALLLDHGWTWVTALCTMVLFICRGPCGTTLLTTWRETRNLKWTLLSLVMPLAIGIFICLLINLVATQGMAIGDFFCSRVSFMLL